MRKITVIFVCLTFLLSCVADRDFDSNLSSKNQEDGWVKYNQNDFSQALVAFERAVSLNPNLSDAHNGLGWAHLSMSQVPNTNTQIIATAQRSFQDAILADTQNSDAWIGLANVLFLRRQKPADFEAAIQAIENALAADRAYFFRHDYDSIADIHILKAFCYYHLGKKTQADSIIRTVLKSDPSNQSAAQLKKLLAF